MTREARATNVALLATETPRRARMMIIISSAPREMSSDRAPSALRGVSSSHPTTPRALEAETQRLIAGGTLSFLVDKSVARIASEESRKSKVSFLFFRRRFDAVRASLPRRAERLRRGCVVPTTSRERDGDLHREPRTRKRCRSSGSSARRARLDCLARMETERENAVKFDATAERRSCGRVEIFDLGITVCLPAKSRQKFFRLEKLARSRDSE